MHAIYFLAALTALAIPMTNSHVSQVKNALAGQSMEAGPNGHPGRNARNLVRMAKNPGLGIKICKK